MKLAGLQIGEALIYCFPVTGGSASFVASLSYEVSFEPAAELAAAALAAAPVEQSVGGLAVVAPVLLPVAVDLPRPVEIAGPAAGLELVVELAATVHLGPGLSVVAGLVAVVAAERPAVELAARPHAVVAERPAVAAAAAAAVELELAAAAAALV